MDVPKTMNTLLSEIAERFESGTSATVTAAWITKEEFDALCRMIEDLKKRARPTGYHDVEEFYKDEQ